MADSVRFTRIRQNVSRCGSPERCKGSDTRLAPGGGAVPLASAARSHTRESALPRSPRPPGEAGQPARRLSGPTASVPSGGREAKRDDLLVLVVARALRGAGSRRAEAAPRKGSSRAAATAPVIATRRGRDRSRLGGTHVLCPPSSASGRHSVSAQSRPASTHRPSRLARSHIRARALAPLDRNAPARSRPMSRRRRGRARAN